jgi:hypothetical protein
MENIVVTLRADRGNKFDEDGQCIGTHERSIVFMPREVKPDQVVRVRLIPIMDRMTGKERVDKGGRVMYRAELAPAELPRKCEEDIARQAKALRQGKPFPKDQGEALAKSIFGKRLERTDHKWYYFFADAILGSRFSPAALLILEGMPMSSGSSYDELMGWLIGKTRWGYNWYHFRESGKIGKDEVPEFPEIELRTVHNHYKSYNWYK